MHRTIPHWTFFCDGCSNVEDIFPGEDRQIRTMEQAKQAMRVRGWLVRRGRDLCPVCRKEGPLRNMVR